MKRDEILEYLKTRKQKKTPTMEELASELNVSGKELTELISTVRNMELTGEVIFTKKKRIALPEDMGFYTGKIQLHQKGLDS